MKINYAPESIEDLKRLRKFIAEKNPDAAKRVACSLLKGIKRLKTFPKLGLEVQEADTELIRDLILGDYIVRYLLSKNTIHILRVWHQKENWKNK